MSDLSGRTVLITGASSGIGLAASRWLAELGANLILVSRDAARLDAAAALVRAHRRSAEISVLACDLSSLAAVRALAARVRERSSGLHVLVNNAGVVTPRHELTAEGHERTFAINHLAPYLLTRLLLGRMVESGHGRVITVSSGAHRHGSLDLSDLRMHRGYAIVRAYCRSKLANVLFTRELARRLAATQITANCFHPGTVATRFWSHAPWYTRPLFALARPFMRTAEEGATTLVALAASPDVETLSGAYFDGGEVVDPAPQAQDDELARRLWVESARLVDLEP